MNESCLEYLLYIEKLRICAHDGRQALVDLADLTIAPGEIVGLVGCSGAGKSLAALGIMGLAAEHGLQVAGRVMFDGVDMLSAPDDVLDAMRGHRIAMMFQDPAGAVDPARTCRAQFREALRGAGHSNAQIDAQALSALRRTGLGHIPDLLERFPQRELSGGERQRFLLALTSVHFPALLIVDEPTTGLDPLARLEFAQALRTMRTEHGVAVLLISHDIDLVQFLCDRVLNLAGGVLASATNSPAIRPPFSPVPRSSEPPMLRLNSVSRKAGRGPAARMILADINLELRSGEALGIIGRSGSGKSTLAAVIAGLLRPDSGLVELQANDSSPRRPVQFVFQDYRASLDPIMRIDDSLVEILVAAGGQASDWAMMRQGWFDALSLPPDVGGRRPHQLSGGQLQRVALLRALIGQPRLLLTDEPTSSLDHEARGRFTHALADVRRSQPDLALIVISHDLDLVLATCDRVAVLDGGRIVEHGPTTQLMAAPISTAATALVQAWFSMKSLPSQYPAGQTSGQPA